MIFLNPRGAPELACDACGCRWFDRMANTCYECGAAVGEAMVREFEEALRTFQEQPSRPRETGRAANVISPTADDGARSGGNPGTPQGLHS